MNTSPKIPGPAPIVRDFGSWSGYVEAAGLVPRKLRAFENASFCGCTDYADALTQAKTGNADAGEQAREMIDRMESSGVLSVSKMAFQADVCGFMPIVPAVVAGHPMSMLSRGAESVSMLAPLRVYAGIGGGATITADQLLKRGIAIAAFVMAMQQMRTVELHAFSLVSSFSKKTLQTYKIETDAIDLPMLAHIVSGASVHRCIAFSMADIVAESASTDEMRSVPYAGTSSAETMRNHELVVRAALGLDDGDLFIPRLAQNDDALVTNPEQWVKDKIAHYSAY